MMNNEYYNSNNYILIALFACLCLLLLTSCTKKVNPQPAGGSKADGMIKLSYRIHAWNNGKMDKIKVRQKAAKRCKTWGYEGAKYFGTTKKCVQYGEMGCTFYRVFIRYQCVD